MKDIPGKFVGLFLAFFLCVIGPVVNINSQQEMLMRRQILSEMSNFIDEVVDARAIYPSMRKELVTRLNSYGVAVNFKIVKEQRSIDASIVTTGNTESVEGTAVTSYIPVPLNGLSDSDTIYFSSGDRVGIEVVGLSYTGIQNVTHSLSGLFLPKVDYRLYARVR